MSDSIETALRAAHHELTTLHGLRAYDGAAPGHEWAIDVSAALALLDAALAFNELADTDIAP